MAVAAAVLLTPQLDGQQAYRQALAYWATGDTTHADNSLSIIKAWATTNKQWGVIGQNGPLEAGWGSASMSKALELLKHKPWPGYDEGVYQAYCRWYTTVLKPQVGDRGVTSTR